MSIGIEDAKEIARLCNLDFSEAELTNITRKINNILVEVRELVMLEECIETTKHGGVNIFRNDESFESLDLEDVFRNTCNRRDDYFSIPNNNRGGC